MSETQGTDPIVSFDWTAYESPSTAVPTVVAAATGVDPLDADPLFEAIDPDALDRLVSLRDGSRGLSDGRVSFSYQGFRVAIDASGRGHLYDEGEQPGSLSGSASAGAAGEAD